MRKVYIAGPYTHGDVAQNVARAMAAADRVIRICRFAPYVPHLSHFQHMAHPLPYDRWLELDRVWLRCCDAVLRLPGESKGADQEVELARELGIPVYHSWLSLVEGMAVIAEAEREQQESVE